MRLRVLLTNGERTVDLIWLKHNGTDVYYGWVGFDGKHSYHGSGKRHYKNESRETQSYQKHHKLENFKGQFQLICFGFSKETVNSERFTPYRGKKGDAILYLDARVLPKQFNVSLGLLEVGAYKKILPVHEIWDLQQVFLVTNTTPWIYVMVFPGEPHPPLANHRCP